MKTNLKSFVFLTLIISTVFMWSYACETPSPTHEPSQESSPQESASEATASDASPPEAVLETPIEAKAEAQAEPIPEAPAKLAWEPATLEKSLIVGIPHTIALPEVTGGQGEITYLLETKVDGVTLEGKALKVRLSYQESKALSFAVTAKDATQQAQLQVTFTPLAPQWTKLSDTNGPPARANPAMELAGQRLLVFGGYLTGNTGSNDLWIYDRVQKTWAETKATGDLPPKAGAFRWAITKVEQDGKQVRGIVFQALVGSDQSMDQVYQFQLTDQDVVWTKLTSTGTPPKGLTLGTAGYDPKFQILYVFGGLYPATSQASAELFSVKVSGANVIWTNVTAKVTGPAPAPRFGAQFGMDTTRGRLYIASGTGVTGPLTDLWILHTQEDDGLRWEEIKPEGNFLGRQNGALLVDAIHNRIFIWGGSAQGVGPLSVSSVNLDDNPPKWIDFATPSQLDGRTSIYGISDPTTGESFFGFGRNPDFIKDVWSFQPNPTP